jgi:hypothetical protein
VRIFVIKEIQYFLKMDFENQRIRVIFQPTRDSRFSGSENPRNRFWNLASNDPEKRFSDEEVTSLEANLTKFLGRQLRDELIRDSFGRRSEYFFKNGDSIPLAGIQFKFEVEEYSSLIGTLVVTGLTKLAEHFGGNPLAFEIFLTSYLPIAFHESQPLGFEVNAKVNIDNDFFLSREARRLSERRGNDTPATGKLRESLLVWKLANGSLLIPVLLMIGILVYFEEKSSEASKDHAALYESIIKEQQDLITLEDQDIIICKEELELERFQIRRDTLLRSASH